MAWLSSSVGIVLKLVLVLVLEFEFEQEEAAPKSLCWLRLGVGHLLYILVSAMGPVSLLEFSE